VAPAAVVTPHFLATSAAIDVLSIGGSAIDAAIAADAVLGVVAPETCGVGGDLFALIHRPGMEKPVALNSSGRAGSNADSKALRDQGYDQIPPMHAATVTVPGCVDGWHALAAWGGRLNWDDRLAAALRYAQSGFPASAELARSLHQRSEFLASQAIGTHLYPSGRPPQPGDHLTRPDLAETLRDIAEGHRDRFYLGQAGKAIADAVGGLIDMDDLARSQAEWVEPLGRKVFGLDAWTIPPNSQGYLTLAAAAQYEAWREDDLDEVDRWHLGIEAYRSQVADRDVVLADPDHSPWKASDLVSDDRFKDRDLTRRQQFRPTSPTMGGTAYLCVLDAEGVGISFIQSNFMGLGTSIGAGNAGFILQNRGAGFCLIEGHPNELAPGKRPLHTLAPSLWTDQGRLHTLLGTRGGDYQPQLLLQMAVRMFDEKDSPAEAQAQPRWIIDSLSDPNAPVRVEANTSPAVVAGLRDRGHRVEVAVGVQGGWGPVSVIRSDGSVEAAADPRVGTTAAEIL
jgi:gamma-glutamyltranspeptidase/glutathione hydrolase